MITDVRPDHLRHLKRFIDRALDGLNEEPIADQIEIHQTAAIILSDLDPKASDVAAHTSSLLREASRQQLIFRELLREDGK